ncbi:MAG: 5-formyltetrahydrofolate cyclo-ligase [Rhodobacteraceae bacterium]|nr:5-formyltetrahydrofolate cyclo-ligase [Paracoccaceae bacterium]
MGLREEKELARQLAFANRRAAHAAEPGNAAWLLSSVLAGYRGEDIAGYMPIRTEISPLPAMEAAAASGRVGVPVIERKGQPLRFSVWSPGCEMQDGLFGAKIPVCEKYFEPTILLVPLVAFDRKGGRLGYGGGFYDRTLETLRQKRPTLAIGFAYSVQMTEELPREPTDQLLDMVITERDVLSF